MIEDLIERFLENPSDWIWLVVAVLWVLFRVLPRLFGAGPGPVKTTEERHERHEQLDSAEAKDRGSGPPPIVPR